MEHIEEAGIHSGDSSCTLPPITLSDNQIVEICAATEALAAALDVRGLINVQFAYASGQLYVLEANPRASRTVPFVSKATSTQLAKAATHILMGRSIAEIKQTGVLPRTDGRFGDDLALIAVKEAVLPFRRFGTPEGRYVDSLLGPEMRSTGEVMGLAADFPTAFAKAQAGANCALPLTGTVFVSVADRDKSQIVLPIRRLVQLGYRILATAGTAKVLAKHGISCERVAKESESDRDRSIVDMIVAGEVDVVVNTPSGTDARADGYAIRAATTAADKSLFTTVAQLSAVIGSFEVVRAGPFEVMTLQEVAARRALNRMDAN
jgi:carbamoyl-phosphate synthase large subunit